MTRNSGGWSAHGSSQNILEDLPVQECLGDPPSCRVLSTENRPDSSPDSLPMQSLRPVAYDLMEYVPVTVPKPKVKSKISPNPRDGTGGRGWVSKAESHALRVLSEASISVEVQYGGMWLVIRHRIDFFPGTGIWRDRWSRVKGSGLDSLIKHVSGLPDGGS
jgi:hypothetical protein